MKTTTVAVATSRAVLTVKNAIRLQNTGSAIVYLGDATVTADTASTGGYQLATGASLDVTGLSSLYAIAASGGSTLAILGG